MNTQPLNFESFLENATTTISRDLKLNFEKLTEQSALTREEALLVILAIGASLKDMTLTQYATSRLEKLDLPKPIIQEARESSAIMAMLNTYYRFRHMIEVHDPNHENYRLTGLRMNALAKPQMGKTQFEMLAFALSVINGCESCIRSHETSLKQEGVSVEKIHDLARLSAVTRAISTIIF